MKTLLLTTLILLSLTGCKKDYPAQQEHASFMTPILTTNDEKMATVSTPEPTTLFLMGGGLLAMFRKRKPNVHA